MKTKRIMAIITSLAIMLSVVQFGLLSTTVSAIARQPDPEVQTRIQNIIASTGDVTAGMKYLIENVEHYRKGDLTERGHCFNHVKEVTRYLFGVDIPMYKSNGYEFQSDPNWTTVCTINSTTKDSEVWDKFSQCWPGDVLQMRRSGNSSSQHTMIVYSVDLAENKIVIYESNRNNSQMDPSQPNGTPWETDQQWAGFRTITSDNCTTMFMKINGVSGCGLTVNRYVNAPSPTGCVEYPSFGEVTVTSSDAYLKTMPYSSSGNPNSENVYDDALPVGSTYSVLGIVKNKYGNYWYKVAGWTIQIVYTIDDQELNLSEDFSSYSDVGYLYSKDVTFSLGTDTNGKEDWKIAEPLNYPTTHTYNTAFPISGKISAPYSGIRTVHAEIRNSSGIVVQKSVNPGDVHSYNLYKSEINTAMTFKSLAKGTYTYEVSIVLVYYAGYGQTRTEYLSNQIVVLSKDFTVTDGTDNSDNISFDSTKTPVNRYFYASSDNAFMYYGPSTGSGTKTITLGAYGSMNKVPENSIVYVDYVGENKDGQSFYHLIANTGYICDATDDVYVEIDKLLPLSAGTYRVNALMKSKVYIRSEKNTESSSVKLLNPGETFTTTALQDGGLWVDATCSEGSGYFRIGYGEFVSSQNYSVTFNSNGGQNAPSALTFTSAEHVVLPSETPSKNGFVFVGWSSTINGEADYLPGEEYSFDSDITLYAVWQEIVPVSVTVISLPTKTEYKVGEEFDAAGLTIKVTYSDNTSNIISTGFTTSGFSSQTAGQKTVTVTYCEKTAAFAVTVVPQTIVSGGRIVVENKTATVGKEFTVSVRIEENVGFAYLELTPVYSPQLTLVSVNNGALISDFTKSSQYIWVSDENVTANGELMTFTFTTAEGTEPGVYSVGFIVRGCFNYYEENVPFTVEAGEIKIIDITYGDANGDGIINGQDVVRLKKYLANFDYDTGTSSVVINAGADANGDGTINGQDVVRLKKYLANYDYETGTSTIVLGPAA